MDLQAVPEPVFYRIVELRCAFHRKPELVFEEECTDLRYRLPGCSRNQSRASTATCSSVPGSSNR